jgi:hypothetical protein
MTMHQIATVSDAEPEPEPTPPDPLAALESELRLLKAAQLAQRDRLRALEQQAAWVASWPAYAQWRSDQEAARQAAAAARRQAEHAAHQARLAADVLAPGDWLLFGDLVGGGEKLTEAGWRVVFGRNSQGAFEYVAQDDEVQRLRSRRRYYRVCLERARDWLEYNRFANTEVRDLRGWILPTPPQPALLPAGGPLGPLKAADVVAHCQQVLAEIPDPDNEAGREEAHKRDAELLYRSMNQFG